MINQISYLLQIQEENKTDHQKDPQVSARPSLRHPELSRVLEEKKSRCWERCHCSGRFVARLTKIKQYYYYILKPLSRKGYFEKSFNQKLTVNRIFPSGNTYFPTETNNIKSKAQSQTNQQKELMSLYKWPLVYIWLEKCQHKSKKALTERLWTTRSFGWSWVIPR